MQFAQSDTAALARYRADSYTAITQLSTYISATFKAELNSMVGLYSQRWDALAVVHRERLTAIVESANPKADGTFGTGYFMTDASQDYASRQYLRH